MSDHKHLCDRCGNNLIDCDWNRAECIRIPSWENEGRCQPCIDAGRVADAKDAYVPAGAHGTTIRNSKIAWRIFWSLIAAGTAVSLFLAVLTAQGGPTTITERSSVLSIQAPTAQGGSVQ